MSTSMYFEEFEVGRRYPTYTRTITEADLVLFCALVGYHTPMFIDEHYAKKTRFGGRIVPSSLTSRTCIFRRRACVSRRRAGRRGWA